MRRIKKRAGLMLLMLLFSFTMPITVLAADGDWEFIIETEDGTYKTGSTTNDVGFNDHNLLSVGQSNIENGIFGGIVKWWKELIGDDTGSTEDEWQANSYLDRLLEAWDKPTNKWQAMTQQNFGGAVTENGSIQMEAGMDLYIYDGVAFNKNGAAYCKGHYFTVRWENVSEDDDEPERKSTVGVDPMDYTGGLGITEDPAIRGLTADLYSLAVLLSICGMILSIMLAGFKLAAMGNRAIKEGLLEAVGTKILAFFIINSFVGLFGILGKVLEALGSI